ncbi:MAG: hypothetical protein HQL09_08340 [Nitrospirae bacterium]|nr:hypothetical protein [Nitrospirota bacterium]
MLTSKNSENSDANQSLLDQLKKMVDQEKITYERSYRLDVGQLAVVVSRDSGRCIITLLTDIQPPLILHWGAAYRSRDEWTLPPSSLRPPGTTVFQDAAAQTQFIEGDGFRQLTIEAGEQEAPQGISFVLRQGDTGPWINRNGQNFFIPVAVPSGREAFSAGNDLAAIADEIIKSEMGRNSWTLMHRLNLCYDLLDRIGNNNVEGIALLYVWMRFSYIRQLDWQRNYNTKPRELGHAMGRLTYKLAGRFIDEPGEHDFIRLIMTTLGTGKDAQRVRDEILNIMHRHHIKELSGHFMEEWHQKLHNNATPDDIVICEAWLEFLRSNGNPDLFYKRLEEGGVPRKRLENYERPITSSPVFIAHLKDALIHDFEHFLEILREVHAGTDLVSAVNTSRYLFDADMNSLMDYILGHRNDNGTLAFVLLEKLIDARRKVAGRLGEHQSRVRDFLFLDLALEDLFRAVVEKNMKQKMNENKLAQLTGASLENLCLSNPDEEFASCLLYWKRLVGILYPQKSGPGKLWALQAKAMVDRLQRGLGDFIDRYHRLVQPWAESLGNAFHAAPWTINQFTEEVVRGRPAFVLSLLLRQLDPALRKNADLGNWQVISPGHITTGVVETVPDLKSVQGRTFSRSAVLIAGKVGGDEEIPEGVVALITSASVDVLSHLAVRARNSRVLFAVCYDLDTVERMKSLSGNEVKLNISEAGGVVCEESAEEMKPLRTRDFPVSRPGVQPGFVPAFSSYALPMNSFNEKTSGGKSNNLKRMIGKLPEWIHIPDSAGLPFGVFEKVLAWPANKEPAERHDELVRRLNEEKEISYAGLLEEIKTAILALNAPDELMSSLRPVMESSGLAGPGYPESRDDIWTCIKRVWASKWNERAYLSRKANGIPHEKLAMSVLIQTVVETNYSFVIHTVNPFTNNKDEIYAEVALGLGEALAANYPGRALSFTCQKGTQETRLLSLPGKSVGLFGGGLIFRSDSNGEDLAGYAGAGLYDSFMLPQPTRVTLNYVDEALVWDENFRNGLLIKIADIGTSVENALATPQDIEGAYSNGQYYVVQTRPQAGLENG